MCRPRGHGDEPAEIVVGRSRCSRAPGRRPAGGPWRQDPTGRVGGAGLHDLGPIVGRRIAVDVSVAEVTDDVVGDVRLVDAPWAQGDDHHVLGLGVRAVGGVVRLEVVGRPDDPVAGDRGRVDARPPIEGAGACRCVPGEPRLGSSCMTIRAGTDGCQLRSSEQPQMLPTPGSEIAEARAAPLPQAHRCGRDEQRTGAVVLALTAAARRGACRHPAAPR